MSSLPTSELAADPRVARGLGAQLAARRVRIGAGEESLGWKIGFGAPAAMRNLGISAPLTGYLMRSGLAESGSDYSIGDWANPMLEPEVAVHMASDLPPGSGDAAVEAAVKGLGPAFELADLHPPPADPEPVLAANIFQRGVVLAPCVDGASAAELTGHITRSGGETQVVEDPWAPTGELVALIRHVADLLGAFGEWLRAGDVVICGSIVAPPLSVSPGDEVDYELKPLGALSIRLTD